eukprot:1978609-Amphidinium_carterae.1
MRCCVSSNFSSACILLQMRPIPSGAKERKHTKKRNCHESHIGGSPPAGVRAQLIVRPGCTRI